LITKEGGALRYVAVTVGRSKRSTAAATTIRAGDQLKTAKALGLTVPNSMQLLADEVIELARAQQGERLRRIGVLTALSESDPEVKAWLTALEEGLQSLALLWQILSGTGFINQFFCDSWAVGFWGADHGWQAGRWIGKKSLDAFSSRFRIGWSGDKCVHSVSADGGAA
jgi:hypothetical protein